MRTKSTIAILSISLLIQCVVCFLLFPLMTSRYDEETVRGFQRLKKTEIGNKLAEHYFEQFKINRDWNVGPYNKMDSEDTDRQDFVVAGFMFASTMALFVSFISFLLFIINSSRKEELNTSKKTVFLTLLLIILNGIIIRLLLASAVFGQWDMQSYAEVADIVTKGGNVYAETGRYNYSPVWFIVLGTLKKIQMHLPMLSFHLVVRSFLCLIDLLVLLFLLLIARQQHISLIKTAIFFFLSPIVFLTTGHQGQFEGFAILMLVAGIYAYLRLKDRPTLRLFCLWILATAGMVVKHNIFYETIICLHYTVKRYWVKLLLFTVSVCIFFATFLPYLGTASEKEVATTYNDSTFKSSKEGIIKNVFMYSSENWQQFNSKSFGDTNIYGIATLYNHPKTRNVFKYVFIVGMFIFPFFIKSNDLIRRCMLGALFFLVFATGICHQYFVLPVALAALRPSKGFLFYSLTASMCILGFFHGVYVPIFHLLRLNLVWVAVTLWFAFEIYHDRVSHRCDGSGLLPG